MSFEYIVMSGLNDSPRHIRELTRLLNGIKCRINLIRFHRIPDSPYFSPGDEAMVRFRDALTARGIQTTIRASRGEDIQGRMRVIEHPPKRRDLGGGPYRAVGANSCAATLKSRFSNGGSVFAPITGKLDSYEKATFFC